MRQRRSMPPQRQPLVACSPVVTTSQSPLRYSSGFGVWPRGQWPQNGLGWSVAQARAEVEAIRSRFLVLEEPPAVVDLWLDIVARHDLKGKRIHDAHLLATMKANGVTRLLTLNAADFPAESGISILTPDSC